MPDQPAVLFVCVHNAGRSQMAAGWLSQLAGDRVEVRSAGSAPAHEINPVAVAVMREAGIDITASHPKILTGEAVRDSDVVITMGCGDTCPFFPGRRYEDWKVEDPAGQAIDAVRRIRDDIRDRVQALLSEILPGAARAAPRPEPLRTQPPQPQLLRIEPMTAAHAPDVLAIYQAGIDEGNATFETRAPAWDAFSAAKLPGHRFVAISGGGAVVVVGWVVASAVSDRCAYAGVVEHSVYVSPAARGRGAGRQLLDALIASTEAAGIWTIQSGLFPENTASVALHRAAGFRVVGTRERLGQHHGTWRDVVQIERRSPVI
jgi:L-amino acid N-acyltransferase YncA/protein-tyrosine-phosphatase